MPRTIFRSLFIAALLAFAAVSAAAQQIQGEVRNVQTGQPVLGALVHCDGTGGTNQVLTDRNGKFYFRVSPGHYNVYVSAPGFVAPPQSADLTDTQSSEYLFFRLREDPAHGSAPNADGSAAPGANVPAKAREEFDKGSALVGEGKKEKAEEGIAHLEKAVGLYPNYLQAELMLGTTYMDLQQWDKAEKALKRALEINPKTANADFALGTLYLQQKKYAEAEKVLKDGLTIEDRSYQGHLTLARLYWAEALATRDEAQARPALEQSYQEVNQALKLNPDLADAHLLKGNLLLRVRRAPDALNEFQEYLRLAPNGPFAQQARDISKKIQDALAKKP